MKKVLITSLATGMIVLSVCGQKLKESQVPAATRTAFQKEHPNTNAGWEKEGVNYEANFKMDGKSMSSVIDKNGTVLETETDIPVSDLPQSARAYIKEHYKGANVKGAAKIQKSSGKVNYEAEVNGKDIVFDANGKFLKEEKD
jgi:Putative beta-lactamase-inhibitor-like, PepSY-like